MADLAQQAAETEVKIGQVHAIACELSGLSQQARNLDCDRAAFLIDQAIIELGGVASTRQGGGS